MYETLLRPHEVNTLPTLQSISAASERLKKAEQKREEKRLRQIASSRSKTGDKRKREGNEDEDMGDGSGVKKVKSDDDDTVTAEIPDGMETSAIKTEEMVVAESFTTADSTNFKVNMSKAIPEVRGHTSYLTFACLLPVSWETNENQTASSTGLA
jgi:tRNA (adenine57-N1/adenine58-N1)-methyltransferase catalytic subunit